MAEWGRSFLYSGMPGRLDSPGPIPDEYSRQYQAQNQGIIGTDRPKFQHSTTITWHSEAQTSQAEAGFLASTKFQPTVKPPTLLQPISHDAQGSFFVHLQAGLTNKHAYGIAGAMGRTQQEENRPLPPAQQRIASQHVHSNGNQYFQGRPLSFTTGQQPQTQQIYQASQFESQLQVHSTDQTQRTKVPQQSLQPSESRPDTSGSKKERPSVKHLTCWWWNEKGQCRYSVDDCLYAHHKTGRVADAPRQVKPGEAPVAGRKLVRALREEADERAQSGPERDMGILQAQNKALREAYVALSSTTSQSLSTISTLRQSVTRLAAEVVNVERDRASHHQQSTTPVSGIYQKVDTQLTRPLRAVQDQSLLAGVVEGHARTQVARVEKSLVREGLGEVVEEGKRRAMVP